MSDRLPSDHPAVRSVRARVARHGGGTRLDVEEDVLPETDVARVILDGQTRYGALSAGPTGGGHRIVGIFATPGAARGEDPGDDLLPSWLAGREITVGSSVHLDEIEPDFAYGLREPGERVVYQGVEAPKRSLADIAKQAEDRRDER